MNVSDETTREDLKKRLRRIAGQVRGVEKMVDDGRECRELLQQLAAIRSAVQQASQVVAHAYACQRLATASGAAVGTAASAEQDALVEELINIVSKAS